MVPIPTVPTDSLYKFQALGGIIALLTSLTLFVTEVQKALVENIKLESTIALYNLNIKQSKERDKEIIEQFKQDSLQFVRVTKDIKRDEKLSAKGQINYTYKVDGKSYSLGQYKNLVYKEYSTSLEKYNSEAGESAKISYSIKKDGLLVTEKISLVRQNSLYVLTIGAITLIVLLFSGKFVETGFKKWRSLQNLSDELAELQVKKARKEDEGDKPKLILPD